MKKILQYIEKGQRHRMFFVKELQEDIVFVDVGNQLSSAIQNFIERRNVSLFAENALDDIIKKNIVCDDEIGEYIAIKNIGILFEPLLKFDLHAIFDKWAKSYVLIVHLEGMIKNKTFYLGVNEDSRYSINFSDITFKILEHEI